ncbi:hypothetical protein ACFE04_031588 [Oxalis oulophora]
MGVTSFSKRLSCLVQLRNFPYRGYCAFLFEKEPVFDFSRDVNDTVDSIVDVVQKKKTDIAKKRKLFPVVVRVYKTLNWFAASKVKFSKVVGKYGLNHSMDANKIIIHVFALAGKQFKANALIWDIIDYYKEASLDVFDLFPTLLDSRQHPERSVLVFDVLMNTYATNSMLEHALDVFVQTKSLKLKPNLRSCNLLLRCLVQANCKKFVRSLFDDMKNDGPLPDEYTYTIMLNFYCGGHEMNVVDVVQAKAILEEMVTNGLFPTVVTYGTYIRGLCRAGLIELAMGFIRNLRSRNQPLNSYSYNAVIQAFCQKGEVDEGFKVWEEMKSHCISMDEYTYNILIHAYSKKGNIEQGLKLMNEMLLCNINPSTITYTSLFDALCKKEMTNVALDLYQSATEIKFNVYAYNALINGCYMQGDMESASKLFEKIMENGDLPSAFSFKMLIEGFCKKGLLDAALTYFNIMVQSGMLPSIFICNLIVECYCKDKQLIEALRFVHKVKELGTTPNSFTYDAIIHKLMINYSSLMDGIYVKESISEEALMLYGNMFKLGITPNIVTYTVLISEFCKERKMSEAYGLFKEMTEKGLVPDVVSITCVIDGLYINPDEVTYNALIAGYKRNGYLGKALDMFNEMKKMGIEPDEITYETIQQGVKPDDITSEKDVTL